MKILDACCGSKMFWFDKEHNETCYMDKRTLDTTLCDGRKLIVKPDVIADFRKMPFDDESFYLVVFDPPHLLNVGDKSFLALKYGKLEQITLPMLKGLFPNKPIFGQRRGKTVWLVFFKGESE